MVMTATDNTATQTTYNLLRASLLLFKKSPSDLTEVELNQAKTQATNEFSMESIVLSTPEAASVIISDKELAIAYQEIRSRYDDEENFVADLSKNQLTKDDLMAALRRQCKVNTVLELVGRKAPSISDIEIGIYYHLHPEQFNLPERREVSHIFLRINPGYPENIEQTIFTRAKELASRLQKKTYKFADFAVKNSECPTALKGGDLGTVQRGILHPELEKVLFTMKKGEVSQVIRSEIGFHILLCKNIIKAEVVSLAKATPRIRQLMQDRARRTCQRAWLASLPKPESGGSYYE